MITITHNQQQGSVPLNQPRTALVRDLSNLVSNMADTTTVKLLGLRQNNNVYPIQLVSATPASFQDGVYEAVVDVQSNSEVSDLLNQQSQAFMASAASAALPYFNLPVGDQTPSSSVAPRKITYTTEDLVAVERLVTQTGMCGLDPHDVYDAILIATDNQGAMTLRQFTTYVDSLLQDGEEQPQPSTHSLKRLLLQLFYALDNNNRGVVNSDDLTAVFVVLCRGSVPHKLRFLFEVFGTRGVDGLTRRQFWKYVRALLTGLVHLSSDGAGASDVRATLNASAVHMSSSVFDALPSGQDARVQYEQWENMFMDDVPLYQWVTFVNGDTWYNDGGGEEEEGDSERGEGGEGANHRMSIWEKTNKIKQNQIEINKRRNILEARRDKIDEEERSWGTSSRSWTSSRVSMRIELPSMEHPSSIEITQGDVALLRLVTNTTVLGSSSPGELHEWLSGLGQGGLVHREDFEAGVSHQLSIPGQARPNALVLSTLSVLFGSFDRQDGGVCDYDELVSHGIFYLFPNTFVLFKVHLDSLKYFELFRTFFKNIFFRSVGVPCSARVGKVKN